MLFFYIYTLIILGTQIKPSYLTVILFFIYCLIITHLLVRECKNKNRKYFTALYSIFCVFAYLVLHSSWQRYQSDKYYLLVIFVGIPISYNFMIAVLQRYLGCPENHTIKWIDQLRLTTLKYLVHLKARLNS